MYIDLTTWWIVGGIVVVLCSIWTILVLKSINSLQREVAELRKEKDLYSQVMSNHDE